MSSMAPSRATSTAYGSRPTSPYAVNTQGGGVHYVVPTMRDYGYSGGQGGGQHSGGYSSQI